MVTQAWDRGKDCPVQDSCQPESAQIGGVKEKELEEGSVGREIEHRDNPFRAFLTLLRAMVPQSEFLFGVPNSVTGLRSKTLLGLGILLFIAGILSVAFAAIASIQEAVKSYHIQEYTNTHWITTIYLFGGLSTMLLEIYKINFFLYLVLIFCIITVPVSVGAVIADSFNLFIISKIPAKFKETTSTWSFINPTALKGMQMYAAVDLFISLVALIISSWILWEIRKLSGRFFAKVDDFKSKLLFVVGVVQCVFGVVKVVLWSQELVWIKELGPKGQFLFLHYTIDEPIWNTVYCAAGILVIVASVRGTRILVHCAIAVTAICAYPSFLYLWIDYRWLTNVQLSQVTVHVPKPVKLLKWSIGIGAFHLLSILITVCVLIYRLKKSGTSWFQIQLNADKTLRRAMVLCGILLCVAGSAFIISDVYNLRAGTFYRIFYPNEQRAPFIMLCTGVVTAICLSHSGAVYFIPITFCMHLLTFHSTIFHIAAYIFLSFETYFTSQICDLFYYGQSECSYEIERVGSLSHFFEAAMSASILMLTLYVAFLLGRLMSCYQINMGQLDFEEQRKKRFLERSLLILGLAKLALAIVTVVGAASDKPGKDHNHPLIILHSYVYCTCLSLNLLVFPLVQLAFCRNILYSPMRSIALIVLSIIRLIDTVTQIDYRNFGQNNGTGWTIVTSVELVSLLFYYLTLVICAALVDMTMNRVPRFDFVEPASLSPGHLTSLAMGGERTEINGFQPLNTQDPATKNSYSDYPGKEKIHQDGFGDSARSEFSDASYVPGSEWSERFDDEEQTYETMK